LLLYVQYLKPSDFGVGVLGPLVWGAGPKFLGRPAGAPKKGLPDSILGAPVEML
jgi:hypothetical protein